MKRNTSNTVQNRLRGISDAVTSALSGIDTDDDDDDNDGRLVYNELLPFEIPSNWKEHDEQELPYVFIHICTKEYPNRIEPVSYARIGLRNILLNELYGSPPMWYDMKENLALNKYDDNVFPGSILIGLNAGQDMSSGSSSPRAIHALQKSRSTVGVGKKTINVIVAVFEAKDLPQADLKWVDGYTDAFIKMTIQEIIDVGEWCKKHQLPNYAKIFKQENISLSSLADYDKDELKQVITKLGIKDKQKDRFIKGINGIKTNSLRQTEKTSIIYNDLNPKWKHGEYFTFEEIPIRPNKYEMTLEVWDFDLKIAGGNNKICKLIKRFIIDYKLKGCGCIIGSNTCDKHNKKKDNIDNTAFDGWLDVISVMPKHDKLKDKPKSKVKISVKYISNNIDDIMRTPKSNNNKIKWDFDTNYDILSGSRLPRPTRQPMQLRAFIYQAKDLLNRDISGLSDAYLVVRFCGKEARTKTIDNHLDPQWFEELRLNCQVPLPLRQASPRIYCEIYDFDYLGKDQSLGRFFVDIVDDEHAVDMYWGTSSDVKKNRQPDDYWYPIESADGNGKCMNGKVQCAFQLIECDNDKFHINKDTSPKPPYKIPPKMSSHWVNIVVLGLRDIQSAFGVYKPFIEFEINGKLIKTNATNNPTSRNPNYCNVLNLNVNLPENQIFYPNLNIRIKDSLFGGAIKRDIGYASISLDDSDFISSNLIQQKPKKNKNNQFNKRIPVIEEEDDDDDDKDDSKDDNTNDDDENQSLISKKEKEEEEKYNSKIKSKFTENILDSLSITKQKDDDYIGNIYGINNDGKDTTNTKNYPLQQPKLPFLINRIEINDILENINKIDLCPFKSIKFFTGTNQETTRNVGIFKGLISFGKDNDDNKSNNDISFKYLKNFTKPKELYIRLYILDGKINAAPHDRNSAPDPYLIIKYGDKKYNTRDRYRENTNEPSFYESFEIGITLPGPSILEIEMWDYDGIGDDLIGKTKIDIEDRWYSEDWRNIKKSNNKYIDYENELKKNDTNKFKELLIDVDAIYPKYPIETRSLSLDNKRFKDKFNSLRLWTEILTIEDKKKYPNMISISPPPPRHYELRVIVWEVKDVADNDTITDANDLYVAGYLRTSSDDIDEPNLQETDLHYRARGGYGSFNWRFKFPITLPKPKDRPDSYPDFVIQMYDKDYFKPSECIFEATINIAPFLRFSEIYSHNKPCKWVPTDKQNDTCKFVSEKKDYIYSADKFWIDFDEIQKEHDNIEEGGGVNHKDSSNSKSDKFCKYLSSISGLNNRGKGKILLSFELLPENYIIKIPAGFGRDIPNKNPFLPPPNGRHKFNWLNPCDALQRILGDDLCAQLCCLLALISLIAFIVSITPNLVSAITANLVTGY